MSQKLTSIKGVDGVNCTLDEVDQETESVRITLEGPGRGPSPRSRSPPPSARQPRGTSAPAAPPAAFASGRSTRGTGRSGGPPPSLEPTIGPAKYIAGTSGASPHIPAAP